MKTTFEKEQKESNDIVIGDNIEIGGLVCVVVKVEEIFHRTPASYVRVVLDLVGTKTKMKDITLFLPYGTQVEVLI